MPDPPLGPRKSPGPPRAAWAGRSSPMVNGAAAAGPGMLN